MDRNAVQSLVDLIHRAGDAIMEVYQEPSLQVMTKSDKSPVTMADLAAHTCLLSGLHDILDVPILSEEGTLPMPRERHGWSRFWLIDPLDGTREFIDRRGEFTVNIALIEEGKAVMGLVHLPVTGVTYVGSAHQDQSMAVKYAPNTDPQIIRARKLDAGRAIHALVSHRQHSDSQSELLAGVAQRWSAGMVTKAAGSSLKFCLLAEGSADIYPRLGPTSEWDTAAAQAVLEAAGGAVWQAQSVLAARQWPPLSLEYNQRETLLNPSFIAVSDADSAWLQLLQSIDSKKL